LPTLRRDEAGVSRRRSRSESCAGRANEIAARAVDAFGRETPVIITEHAIRRESAIVGIKAMVDEARGLSWSEINKLQRANQWFRWHVYLFHDYSRLLIKYGYDGLPCVATLFQPDAFREVAA
jgi:hypothetical protein